MLAHHHVLGAAVDRNQSIYKNHECTRMHTNFNHKTVHKIHKKLKNCLAAGPSIR